MNSSERPQRKLAHDIRNCAATVKMDGGSLGTLSGKIRHDLLHGDIEQVLRSLGVIEDISANLKQVQLQMNLLADGVRDLPAAHPEPVSAPC